MAQMTSGKNALRMIDDKIAEARRMMSDATGAAEEIARQSAALDAREVEAFRTLARCRADLLKADTVEASLGAADNKARALLARHDQFVAETRTALDAGAARIAALEEERRAAGEARDASVAQHDAAAAATQARIAADPAYIALSAAREAANDVAQRAEQKLDIARDDRAKKGEAYESDPLFVYLRDRKFGAKDYRGFPPFSVGDAMVARLIRYRDAARDYARLIEIPERLSEHLKLVRETAEAKAAEMAAFERAALERDGVAALRDAAAEATKRVEAIDAALASAEETRKAAADAHAAAAAGEHGPAAEARHLLADALGARTLPDLKTLAAQTDTAEDDRIIDEIVRIRRQRMEMEEARKASAATADSRARTADDLEDLRRRFKRARYDNPYSEFPSGFLGAVLGDVLVHGGLDRIWREIARAQRQRERDWDGDFGGGGWRGGFDLPSGGHRHHNRGGSFGGGGFGTGGGFGGGGFNTGGGF